MVDNTTQDDVAVYEEEDQFLAEKHKLQLFMMAGIPDNEKYFDGFERAYKAPYEADINMARSIIVEMVDHLKTSLISQPHLKGHIPSKPGSKDMFLDVSFKKREPGSTPTLNQVQEVTLFKNTLIYQIYTDGLVTKKVEEPFSQAYRIAQQQSRTQKTPSVTP